MCVCVRGFPCSSGGKESACNVGTEPGSGRSPGEGNGNLLQYCCLENPVDRGAWQATRIGHDLATKPTYICVSSVFLSHPTLCSPMDCSSPGSSVHGVSQATILEQVAISFSRGSSQPRDQTHVSCSSRQIHYHQGGSLSHQGAPPTPTPANIHMIISMFLCDDV